MSKARFICRLIDSFGKNAERIGVIDQDGSRLTTYRDFYTTALRVAAYLQARKLPPHSFIPICLPTSMEYLASEMGIWLSGHAVVPMSNLFPQERIDYIVSHCEAPVVITEPVIKEIASIAPATSVMIPEEDDVNALFYTSGSTGTPKGVLHSFRAFGGEVPLDRLLEEMQLAVMGVTTPFYYIASRSVFCVLFRGGTLVIVPPAVVKDIRLLEHFLADQNIEFTFLPPSLLAHFHSQSKALQLVMTGAERLSNIYPDSFRLINHYGQTETCGAGATFIVDKPYENTPIGKPAAHVQYRILDENGQEAEEGELCMKGNLTLGYYKDPERTAELYRGGWLHTGDIVRKLPDGNLVYVNRKDWLVKINGQRVEPGEVEIVLQRMEGIDKAVVKGFTAATGRQYLCAYYISPSGVSDQEIRKYLSAILPDYMVPSYFVRMERFPLNINRKIDRKALLSPIADEDMINRQHYVAPQNDKERMLCEAFEQVLSIHHVGIHDDFFTLGGDSIRVMQLQNRCLELPLSARLIYQYRTPQRIAAACTKAEPFRKERQADYPLSKTQLGIFAACMARQGEKAYNNGMLFLLGNGLDLTRLAKACEAMIEAHPYVKTRLFIDEKGNPRQRRNDDEPYSQMVESVTEEDFSLLKPQLIQPFDLLNDLLFRIRILTTPNGSYLFMDFHHIIFDGMSMGILLTDLEKAYHGESIEQETFSGFEVVQEEEALRETKAYTDAKEWNLQQFGGVDITSLPSSDFFGQSLAFGRQELDLGLGTQELKEACQRFGVTPNVFTIAVFGYLLGHYTYSRESLFATIYHGRHDLKLNHTVSMLVKTLPVHEKWDGDTTLSALLQSTKEQLMGSMANDLFSFAELKTVNNYITSEVLFAYQGDIDFPDLIGGEPFTQLPLMENATGEPLAFEVSRNGDRLTLGAEYHSNAYSDGFINRMMQGYVHLVKTFVGVSDGNVPLTSLPLLSADESQALLAMGCGETLKGDPNDTFVTLFKRQASLTPDAIAVVDKDSSLTYSELDSQSDCIATSLVKAGVVNDTVVALMLPRRKEFLIAVLAVFKAGGAYVSLDYEYPQARIDFMLKDLDTRFLITTRGFAAERNLGAQDEQRTVIMLDQFDFSAVASPIDFSRPQSLAYIIYTSGTTGNPKGVMIEHHSLCSMLEWLIQMEGLKAGDKCAAHPSFSFDASLPDLFGPLICGAQVHIMPSALRYDMRAFSRYLADKKITGLTMSTQIGMELLENHDLSLRYLFLGGENLHVTRKTSTTVINGYGPTEFTVCSSYHVVDSNRSYENIPIGRPVPGSRSLIVGPEGRLVPWGAMGELCLMGRQLARGYWQREQQTRERFVDCPFLPGERMYRTGDLVKWSQDGELLFHGRIDNQVKINGYRIELGEIESSINAFPGIQTSVVILCKQKNLQFLCGFYASDKAIPAEMLRKSLGESLPAYMVPLKLIQVDRMPMTPNGKIDRRQLAEQASNLPLGTGAVELPANRREQVLLDLAKQLLGIDSIGVTDELTQLGLSSLDAIKLAALADKKEVRVKVNDVLRLKTIKKIANHQTIMGEWVQGYDAAKPVAVIIQGLTFYHQLQPLILTLCQHYSVFVIDPLQDHFHRDLAGKTKADIVTAYVELIKQSLHADVQVSAFIGHSYGGEFSYRCAARWQSETGQSARVIMFDTYYSIVRVVEKMQIMQDYILPVEDGTPMPFYSEKVDYFEATQISDKDLQEESMQAWRTLLPHMAVHPVTASHFKLLETQNINYSLSQIII